MKSSHPRVLIAALAIALMASVGAALAQQAGGSCATGSGAGRAQGQARGQGQGQGQGWRGGSKESGQSGGGACVRLNQRLSDGSCTNQACGQAQAVVPAPQQSRRGQRGGGQR